MLLLVAGAYAVMRAIEDGACAVARCWPARASGSGSSPRCCRRSWCCPRSALAYLVAAPATIGGGSRHLAAALGALIVSGGWWVLLVDAVAGGDRPYIGGSQTNSVLELALGYNGFGRLTGDEVGSVGGGGGGWGADRLGPAARRGDGAARIAWLLPAAVVLLAAGLWLTRRAPRTDPRGPRWCCGAAGSLVTALVFSYMNGIIHAVLHGRAGPGDRRAGRHRRGRAVAQRGDSLGGRGAGRRGGADRDLRRTCCWRTRGAAVVLVVGLAVAAGAAARCVELPNRARTVSPRWPWSPRWPGRPAYSLADGGHAAHRRDPVGGPRRSIGARRWRGGPGSAAAAWAACSTPPTPGDELVALLQRRSADYTWAAATVGSNNAAGYQLASGAAGAGGRRLQRHRPVPDARAVPGSMSTMDRSTTSSATAGCPARPPAAVTPARQIAEWVAANYTATTVDGVTVYDLIADAHRVRTGGTHGRPSDAQRPLVP